MPAAVYGYQDPAYVHTVSHLDGVQKNWYDGSGNMTRRVAGATTYDQAWDEENRLVAVTGERPDPDLGRRWGAGQEGAGGETTIYIGAGSLPGSGISCRKALRIVPPQRGDHGGVEGPLGA